LVFPPELRVFLSQAYKLKVVADYDVGPQSQVPIEHAERALIQAEAFVAAVERLLAAGPQSAPTTAPDP
jgi:hypothetical protein